MNAAVLRIRDVYPGSRFDFIHPGSRVQGFQDPGSGNWNAVISIQNHSGLTQSRRKLNAFSRRLSVRKNHFLIDSVYPEPISAWVQCRLNVIFKHRNIFSLTISLNNTGTRWKLNLPESTPC